MIKQQPPIDNSIQIDPANFVATIDNPFFPLQPGTTFNYQSTDGSVVDVFTVTDQTKTILGVECVVVQDNVFTVSTDGKFLSETTLDYFAQDKAGNVWYFGENTKELDANGKVISTEGTWLSGKHGATPGIIMEASPKVGDTYFQEIAPKDKAQDQATVDSLNAHANVPFGNFNHVLETIETTRFDPTTVDHKFYARGVGEVLETSNTGESPLVLVSVSHSGTASAAVTDTFNFDALRTSATAASLPHLADLTQVGNHIDLHSFGASASNQSLAGGHNLLDNTEGSHAGGVNHSHHLTPHDFDL